MSYSGLRAAPLMVDHDELIRFQACKPKRRRTAAWERYEMFKVAIAVGDAFKLGASCGYKARFEALPCGIQSKSLHTRPPPMRLLRHHVKQSLAIVLRLQQIT